MPFLGSPIAIAEAVASPAPLASLMVIALVAGFGSACGVEASSTEGPDAGWSAPAPDAQCQGEMCQEVDACQSGDKLADLIEEGTQIGGDHDLLKISYKTQFTLPYPTIWQGASAISQDNGAHNQGLALSADSIFTTAQDRHQDGWLFVHDRSSQALQCAYHLSPTLFGTSSTGRVHPGGGFFHNGWMYTAISNHPDLLQPGEGRFILAKFRYDASLCPSGSGDCECQVDYEKDSSGRAKVYDSRAYSGLVLRVEDSQGSYMMVYDVNGDAPWICDGETGEDCRDLKALGLFSQPEKTREILDNKTIDKPQQCFTLGQAPSRYQLCTPFPTGGMRLSIHAANPHSELDDLGLDSLGFFRGRLGALSFPALAEDQFGEGVAFEDEQLFVAGDAPVRANCGYASVVKPCTSKDSKQVIRVYEFDGLETATCN